ncbi:MAG: hypothetical protein H7X95_04390, partial [Deltaproteobacteria bacterium]|nr:hypothetical protein [Deltaproteobacteria bacterium]
MSLFARAMFSRPTFIALFVTVALACLGAGVALSAGPPAIAPFDNIRYLPPQAPSAVRGRTVAMRYGLGRRFQLTLQVNNVFAAQNRQAIARAESLIGAIPGVRRVIGPSGLLAINVDARGRASSVPLLAGGPAEDASEIVRQRLIRRSDAIGWFISRDGTEVRLLIDTDDLPSIQTAIESTAASSGLVLLSGVAPASPLWPEPDRVPRPFAPWLPFVLMLISMIPGALGAAVSCRRTPVRAVLVMLTVGLAAAAPALFVPAAGVRQLALWAGGGAALSMATLIVLFRL